MKILLTKHKQFFFLILIFFSAELFTGITGEFPLNDDWAYADALEILLNEGRIDIGTWPAMTLVTHLLWGFLFSKVFGFSFFILRLSTIISAVIGAFFLYRLVNTLVSNKPLALLSAAVMLFNPLMYNLTNSYMTDVNFNTLLIIAVYFSIKLFQTKNHWYLPAVFISYLMIVFLRQFGLIFLVSFPLACLFVKQYKWLYLGFSLLLIFVIIFLLRGYEAYLEKILPPGSSYRFSNTSFMEDPQWLRHLWWNFLARARTVPLHLFIYLFPVLVAFLIPLSKGSKPVLLIVLSVISIGFAFVFFHGEKFPNGNVLENMRLGPENLFQTWQNSLHGRVEVFDTIMYCIKILYSAASVYVIFLLARKYFSSEGLKGIFDPALIFLLSLFAAYFFLLLLSDFYFDRYHIPLITLALLIVVHLFGKHQISLSLACVPLLLTIYVSVAGTKDFLEMNRKKWEAVAYLKNELKVDAAGINAGFEYQGWKSKQKFDWTGFLELNNYDYVIQFDSVPGFRPLKGYEFRRYFPYKKDKINIFVRQADLPSE